MCVLQVAPPSELSLLRDAAANITVLLPPREHLNGLLYAHAQNELSAEEVYDLLSIHIIPRTVAAADLRAAAPEGEVVQTLRDATQLSLTLGDGGAPAAPGNVSGAGVVDAEQVVLSAPVDMPTTVVVTAADIPTCAPGSLLHNISALLVPGEVELPAEARPRALVLQREVIGTGAGGPGGGGGGDDDNTTVIIATVVAALLAVAIVAVLALLVVARRRRRKRAATAAAEEPSQATAAGAAAPEKSEPFPHTAKSRASFSSAGAAAGKTGVTTSAALVQPSGASFASTAVSDGRSPARSMPPGSPFLGDGGQPATPGTPSSPGFGGTPSAAGGEPRHRSRASVGSWYLAPSGTPPSAYRPYDPADTATVAFTVAGLTTRNDAAAAGGGSGSAHGSSGVQSLALQEVTAQHAAQERLREELCAQLDSLQGQPLPLQGQRFVLLGPSQRRQGGAPSPHLPRAPSWGMTLALGCVCFGVSAESGSALAWPDIMCCTCLPQRLSASRRPISL